MKASWVFAVAVILGLAAHGRDRFDAWVDTTQLPPILAQTSVEVRDRDGALLRAFTVETGRWRLNVSKDAVDAGYIAMLLAFEDKRFWRHPGVDPRALARAVAQTLWHGRVVSGGSTLTMQVARLLENSGTGAVPGKLRQMRLALALERQLSKDQILGLYLLHAPFGGNLEGVRAASLAYFGKEPRRLSHAEAALLVALPQSPEARRPDKHAATARRARDRVLDRMVAEAVIGPDEAVFAKRASVPNMRQPMPSHAVHLAERLRREAPLRRIHYTTLDASLQTELETRVTQAAKQAGRGISAALMVMDHENGAVLATVGSAGWDQPGGHLDMTRALRSPGSTLKPLVYGLAFDTGRAHPLSLITDAPVDIAGYAPENFDRSFRGDVTLGEALQLSLNTPVVQLTDMIGPARLVASMEQAGMAPEIRGGSAGLAVALGGVGVRLDGLVQLYGGLARGGEAIPARYVQDGADGGGTRFLSERSAWQVGDILAGVAPPRGAPKDWLAYKTGTSYGHRDAWALGFDGAHVIGVWLGRPDGTAVPGIFGADLAAPLLFEAAQVLAPRPTPLGHAPKGMAHWTQDQLPDHLARVGDAGAVDERGLKVVFPPDGVRLARAQVTLKLERGQGPFTVLVNGAPQGPATRDRRIPIDLGGAGFHSLVVLDPAGASVHREVEVAH